MTPPTVCLCMMVKNEEAVVARALESVKGLIDSWIVVDTGSTDHTVNVVREALAGLPGFLHHEPWVNFSHNRNQVLRFAESQADYLLVLDADDLLEISTFKKSDLTRDYHWVKAEHGGIAYWKIHLFRSNIGVHYEGVTHEALIVGPAYSSSRLEGVVYRGGSGGHRSSGPEKFLENVRLLSDELKKNPLDSRSRFYLAQSWRDAGELGQAITEYQKRVDLGAMGFEEEVFYSLYDMARLSAIPSTGISPETIVARFLAAYERHPTRAEPLWALACYLREHSRIRLAYSFARTAAILPYPEADVLFVEPEVYSWKALDEWAVSAYWVGRKEEAIHACTELLRGSALPEEHRPRISKNLAFSMELP